MAARVNVKFAVALAAGIVLIGGAAITIAYVALNKTGDEYVDRGDAALAAGDIESAAESYERAVGHDRTRLDWLEKWRSTLIQLTPETMVDYERSYNRHYLGILEQMAVLEPFNAERQRDLLEAQFNRAQTLFPGRAGSWQQLAELAGQRIERLGDDPEAQRLRRYRGLSTLNQMRLTDVEPRLRDRALEDLQAAAAADPTDVESARGVVLWRLIQWKQAFLDRREAEARRLERDLDEALAAFGERFPEHSEFPLTALEVSVEKAVIREPNEIAKRASLRELVGQEAAVVEAFRRADPAEIESGQLARLNLAMRIIEAPNRGSAMLELVDRASSAQDVTPRLVQLRTEMLAALGRYDEAIEAIEAYLEEPIRPVSLTGLMQRYFRPAALQSLAEYALAQWEQATDAEAKEASLAKAKLALGELRETARAGEESVPAITVRAKLAQAEERTLEAVRLYTELVEKYGQTDSATRWRLGQSLMEAGQLGAAKQQIQLVLEEDPTDLRAMLTLADIHARLKEDEQARALVAAARELHPNLGALDEVERRLERILERDPEVESLRAAISQSRELRRSNTEADLATAEQLLRAELEDRPDNPALFVELVHVATQRGELGEARRLASQALAANPNNPTLQRLRRSLDFDDPFEASAAVIAESDMTEAQKLVRRARLASSYGREEIEAEAIAALRADHVRDAEALELLFEHALRSGDMDEARRLVDIAAEINADQANGLIYQGRRQMVEGRYEAAVQTLRQAAEIFPFSSELLMLLGRAELELGMVGDGLRTLRRAHEAKPDDARIAFSYATTLTELQRWDEALSVLRSAIDFSPLNLQLRNTWLDLEEKVGDRQTALNERLAMRERYPSNRRNSLALASLLIKESRFDEAEALLGELESSERTVRTATMRARLLAVRDGVDAGRRALSDFLASNEGEVQDASAVVGLADFLFEFDRPDAALEVLEDSRELQSAEALEIDRRLGDYFFNAGDLERSLGYYERLHEAFPGDDRISLRLAEAYGKLERFDEAEAVLATVEDAAENVTAVLIRARAAAAQGRARDARALFDRAVELKPNDPLPFLQRARYNAQDEDQFNDALSDVDRAIRLQPEMITARRMKAEMLASRGRTSEAVSELRRAVQAAPENDELRSLLLQLFVNTGDFASAISFADRTVRDRDGDLYWVRLAGDLSARAAEVTNDPVRRGELWSQAASRYSQLFEEDPSDQIAMRLANALLLQRGPDPARALAIVDGMDDDMFGMGNIQILRARALHALGRDGEAEEAAAASLATVGDDLELRVWFQQLDQMLGSAIEAGRFAEELSPPSGLENTYELQLVTRLASDASRSAELLSRLEAIEGELARPSDETELLRHRGRMLFARGEYVDSAATFERAQELRPDDLEFNNNLAYLRTTFLDDPEGAVEPAERAAQLAPQNAAVLDTLGWVYYRTGQLAEAQRALQSARQYATSPAEHIPVELHLGYVFLERGDRAQAQRMYQSARERLADAPGIGAVYSDQLETLRQRLEEAE